MRCLNCQHNGIPPDVTVCPQCKVFLPSLLLNLLPARAELMGGAYHIDYPLGKGGFGVTYRGIHKRLDRIVAVKEFFPQGYATRGSDSRMVHAGSALGGQFDRGVARFQREGQILARLDHPNVVRVYNIFLENGTAYLVMEYLSGTTLRSRMDPEGGPKRALSPDEIDRVMAALVSALDTSHAAGIFHLDIKPDNVMIEPKRPDRADRLRRLPPVVPRHGYDSAGVHRSLRAAGTDGQRKRRSRSRKRRLRARRDALRDGLR